MVRDKDGDVWLTPQEAADKLGLSVGTIYHYKNSLTHRKGASRIFFLESTLFEDYMSM
jgi:DNA-binding CsgD family transcriptional regulator